MKRSLVLAMMLMVGCSSTGGTVTEPPGDESPPPSTPSPSPTATVQMQSSGDGYGGETHAFVPSAVSVTRGGTVTWDNNTGIAHNVTFDAATGAPGNISDHSSGSNSRSFSTAGSFSYSCTLHAGMTGTVTVVD